MSVSKTKLFAALGAAALCAGGIGAATAANGAPVAHKPVVKHFAMVRSSGAVAAKCIPHAKAKVAIRRAGPVEVMTIEASGLPKRTGFDLFVIQVPDAPFGIAWYQGDFHSNKDGKGEGRFIGRFSDETFAVAPGAAPAPKLHETDATTNPQFAPVHMFHLGLWFNSPKAAARAGCPNTVTPFNGEHTAGVQALSTRNFGIKHGPLRRVKS
jgi:hypothetical protein